MNNTREEMLLALRVLQEQDEMYVLQWLQERTAEEQTFIWSKIQEDAKDVNEEIIKRFAQLGMRHALLLHYKTGKNHV